jgi:hypothetical protein
LRRRGSDRTERAKIDVFIIVIKQDTLRQSPDVGLYIGAEGGREELDRESVAIALILARNGYLWPILRSDRSPVKSQT